MKRFVLFPILIALSVMGKAQKNDHHILVERNNAASLLKAIAAANERNADEQSERLFIILPDGTYDLGDRVLTAITGHNISIIGQSMRGTIIRNKPDVANEGISKTGTLQNWGTGLYLQDLTLQNALDYYNSGAAGRAVCLHDKGTRTICKRVRMLSYQDTYYSDNETCQHYFEESEIHGTVDFICGAGDVYFNRCTLVTERRNVNGGGHNVIVAPRTSQTPWGYVFESCTIRNVESEFHYARGWHTSPRCVLLRTTLATPELLCESRFDSNGMRTVNSEFYEYGTMDLNGDNITPASNVVTFTLKDEKNAVETILTKEQARRYQLKKIFPDWRPEKISKRIEKQGAKLLQQLRQ